MRTILVIIAALSLQGCAMYLEALRISQTPEWQQRDRQVRLQSLERQIERDLRELRKRQ